MAAASAAGTARATAKKPVPQAATRAIADTGVMDRVRATAMVFDLARRERDAWLNRPPRVAANMAAELCVDARRMEQVLDMYLRQHLTEMAEATIEIR